MNRTNKGRQLFDRPAPPCDHCGRPLKRLYGEYDRETGIYTRVYGKRHDTCKEKAANV